jgi:hypothetical protein
MNERIQELSEQAEKYADDWFRGEPTWSEAFESKFAELIVQECITKIENEAAQYAEPVWAFELVNDIREHFGVEP